jgi:hypothetical protein
MLRIRTSITGQPGAPYLSTMYFTAAVEDLTAANAANDAVGAFWGTIDNQMLNGTSWATHNEVAVLALDGTLTGTFGVAPQFGAGAIFGNITPPATQGLVKWATNLFIGGRRLRGHTFIPAIPTTNVAGGGTPAPNLLTAMDSAAATLIADANAQFVIWSRKHTTTSPVVTGGGWNEFAVLRSRRD